jgi:hypothetical protein
MRVRAPTFSRVFCIAITRVALARRSRKITDLKNKLDAQNRKYLKLNNFKMNALSPHHSKVIPTEASALRAHCGKFLSGYKRLKRFLTKSGNVSFIMLLRISFISLI